MLSNLTNDTNLGKKAKTLDHMIRFEGKVPSLVMMSKD